MPGQSVCRSRSRRRRFARNRAGFEGVQVPVTVPLGVAALVVPGTARDIVHRVVTGVAMDVSSVEDIHGEVD